MGIDHSQRPCIAYIQYIIWGVSGYEVFLCAFIASMSDIICAKPRNKPLPGAFIAYIHGIIGDRHWNKRVPEAYILSVEDII